MHRVSWSTEVLRTREGSKTQLEFKALLEIRQINNVEKNMPRGNNTLKGSEKIWLI